MATNPYSYGSLGQRWTVGEPTSKSLLDVSRVKADANRWALEQLIVDPDDTANFVLTAPGLNIDSNTLYVDSVNNSVGFGLTNPNDYAFNGTPSWVASGGAGNASVIVVSGTTSIGYLAFADGTTGTDRYSGNIQYNHSTNTMSFRTNGGVEAMTINSAQDLAFSGDVAVNTSTLKVDTSNNRVGVKNASPSYPLDIGYTAGINQVAWRGSTNEIGFLTYGSSTDAGAVQLSSGGAAKILFDAAGNSYINTGSNFGINTASPTQALDVAGQITINNGSGYLWSTGAVQMYSNGSYLRMRTGSTDRLEITSAGAIEIPNQNAINELTFTGTDYTNIFSNTTGGMQFGTTGAGSYLALYAANAEAIHIDSSQNVGIGTSAPVALSNQTSLTVNGTSVGRVDVKAGGGGGGVMFGTSSALTVQANSGVAVNLDSASGQPITFQVGSSEKARILSSGGITFNGDTATANALDDYEEGTYSVTDQSGAGLSFTVNSNRYVKIGKLVWIGIEIVFPTTSDTNIVYISLPFAQSTAQRASLSCVTNRSDVTVQGYASTGTARLGIIESAASPVSVTNASLSGKYVIIGGVYEAA